MNKNIEYLGVVIILFSNILFFCILPFYLTESLVIASMTFGIIGIFVGLIILEKSFK